MDELLNKLILVSICNTSEDIFFNYLQTISSAGNLLMTVLVNVLPSSASGLMYFQHKYVK